MGQILPYLRAGLENRFELRVDMERGYRDPLHEVRTGTVIGHPGKYT